MIDEYYRISSNFDIRLTTDFYLPITSSSNLSLIIDTTHFMLEIKFAILSSYKGYNLKIISL